MELMAGDDESGVDGDDDDHGRCLKKAKTQVCKIAAAPADNLSIEVVMMSGEKLSTLSVESSWSVRRFLDDSIIPLTGDLAHNRIVRLVYLNNILHDHQTLRDAGVFYGATMTITFEAQPLKLRTFKRVFPQTDAIAKMPTIASKAADCERSLDLAATKERNAYEKVRERKRKLARAEEAWSSAHSALQKERALHFAAQDQLDAAKQDQRTNYERFFEHLTRTPGPTTISGGRDAILDACTLHVAGDLDDDELVQVAEIIAAYSSPTPKIGALKAMMSLIHGEDAVDDFPDDSDEDFWEDLFKEGSPVPVPCEFDAQSTVSTRVLHTLSMSLSVSEVRAGGDRFVRMHDEIEQKRKSLKL